MMDMEIGEDFLIIPMKKKSNAKVLRDKTKRNKQKIK